MHCSALGQAPLRRTGVPGVAEAASASPSAAGRILTRLSSPMRGVSRSSGSPRSVAAFRSERFGTSRIATGEKYRDPRSRLSRLVIVSTAMERDEGHPSYPSQSLYPAKGTTVGGEWDDPDDSITHDAPACHAARPGIEERHAGLPGGRHLAHSVLSVAEAVRALWSGWLAPTTAPAAARPTAPDCAARRASDHGRGPGVADVGVWARGGARGTGPRAPRGPEHGAADPAARAGARE
jgi:hypothetical protein